MATEYYSSLLEELASRGFVVLALDHAHEGKGQILPDGRRLTMEVDKHRPPENVRAILDFYRKRVEQRAADAAFVLSHLPSLADSRPLVARIDFARVGALDTRSAESRRRRCVVVISEFSRAKNWMGS